MNILAIQSCGNSTSLCVVLKDDVLQYSINHERKDRPNWSEMLSAIGLDSFFSMDDIDGGLIGGASLDSESFEAIINSF